MTSISKIHSGGIKPLNAPREVHVRTDAVGNPTAVHVPPAIDSPRARRNRRNNPQPAAHTSPPSLRERELEGDPNRLTLTTTNGARTARTHLKNVPSAPLVSDGNWVKVIEIENLWKVNDEWWHGPEEEIARLYYVLRLESGQQLTVYLDLVANSWHRQAG